MQPLRITAVEDGTTTIKLVKSEEMYWTEASLEYRTDSNPEWQTYDLLYEQELVLPWAGSWVEFKNESSVFSSGSLDFTFQSEQKFDVSGQLASMYHYDENEQCLTDDLANYTFQYLFKGSKVRSVNNKYGNGVLSLGIDSATIGNYALYECFKDCLDLEDFPNLSQSENADASLTTSQSSFESMFSGCSNASGNLGSNRINIHANGDNCMARMFYGCSSLESAEAIHVDMDGDNSSMLENMFEDCSAMWEGPNISFKVSSVGHSSFNSTFKNCSALANLYLYEFSNVTNVYQSAFSEFMSGCSNFAYFPIEEIRLAHAGAYSFYHAFFGCTNIRGQVIDIHMLENGEVDDGAFTEFFNMNTFSTVRLIGFTDQMLWKTQSVLSNAQQMAVVVGEGLTSSLVIHSVHAVERTDDPDYLTITNVDTKRINVRLFDNASQICDNIEYSLDGSIWNSFRGRQETLDPGASIMFRNTTGRMANDTSLFSRFYADGKFSVSGDIGTLLDYRLKFDTLKQYGLYHLFYNNAWLVDTSGLKIDFDKV